MSAAVSEAREPTRPPQAERKILGVELLRILSSIAVLVFHYHHFKFVGDAPVDFVRSQQPFYPLLALFYDSGFYGVEVFWCISGFIFFWKYSRPLRDASLGGGAFFVLRLSRLYPLHFVTLIFMAAMQALYYSKVGSYFVYQYNDSFHFGLQLFMASNWGLQAGDSFNGPIWSISIEVLVYAVFFLSLRFVSRSAWFMGGIALAAAAVQMSKLSTHPVFPCLMFFYLGCLTAIVYDQAGRTRQRQQAATACAVLMIIALLGLGHFVDIKAKYFLVLFSPALIYLCVTHIPSAGLAARILVPAGNMTYASYLLHVPVQIAIVTLGKFAGVAIPFHNAGFFLAYLAVILLLSHWTYVYFEMPAQKILRRTLMARRSTAAAAA